MALSARVSLALFASIALHPDVNVVQAATTKSGQLSIPPDVTTTAPSEPATRWTRRIGDLTLDSDLKFQLGTKLGWTHDLSTMETRSVTGQPTDCSDGSLSTNGSICLEWPADRRLTVELLPTSSESQLTCYDVEWTALTCANQVISDCVNVTTSHWYGGYENTHQLWPLEKNTMPLTDYVSHDGFWPGIGNVLERYFVSSSGVGIFLDNDVPLFFSLNSQDQGHMCFTAQYTRYPYLNLENRLPNLKYTLCDGPNVKDTHMGMAAMFIPRPSGTPHSDLFKYPIWSTWAQYHEDINQTKVTSYANDIHRYNFTCAQVEIDTGWTPEFGDYIFNIKKYPNATEMVDEIKTYGYKVALWVHPFFNNTGVNFKEAVAKGYLVRQFESDQPQLTSWWNGDTSGMLDVSNEEATEWYLSKLDYLRTEYHADTFKFDAGELNWLPHVYSMANMTRNPNDNYPTKYVQMAAKADPEHRQEVRSAYKNQDLPIFIRQIDKLSQWQGPGSYETIISGVLTFGLIGYPFVLPDMVGGNAYGDFPEPELFIRWMQMNTFMPNVQFSILPWVFNDSVVDIVRNYMELHTSIADSLIHFANQSVHTGEPIIRPLWWIDHDSELALTCSDQFLVGDQYLVAPVIAQGARSRDIYITSGDWVDMLRGNGTHPVIRGPTVLTNYKVELHELAYFQNVKYIN